MLIFPVLGVMEEFIEKILGMLSRIWVGGVSDAQWPRRHYTVAPVFLRSCASN